MAPPRFFISEVFKKGIELYLPEEEFKHAKVLRLAPEDTLFLINGKNQLAKAKVILATKKQMKLEILSVETCPKPIKQVFLFQSYTKPPKIDLILEKGTELGVNAFYFFPSEKGEKPCLQKKQRHHAILLSAIKQCKRLDLPEIHYLDSFSPPDSLSLFFGDLRPSAPHLATVPCKDLPSIGFINGPESGFTDNEIITFEKLGAKGVSLSKYILRTETAAIVASNLCQTLILN